MAAPTLANAAAMATTTVGSTLNIKFSDDSVRSYQLAYQPFFVTGDMVSDGKGGTILSGGYYDINNKPIIDATVPGKERHYFSDAPDGTSLLTVANPTVTGLKGKTVFAVVQFEYTTRDLGHAPAYGLLPSPIAVLTLDQNPQTGALKLVKYFIKGGTFGTNEIAILGVGCVVAFVVSLIAIKWLMGFVRRHDFKCFGVYRIILGIVVLAYFFVLEPMLGL